MIKTSLKIFSVILLSLVGVILLATSSKSPISLKGYAVQTGSMAPAYPQGSLVFAKPQTGYSSGDAIVFKNNGQVITHRVTEASGSAYQTKGDANNAPDNKLITDDQVLGKVNFSAPYLGKLVLFTKTPLGFILLIAMPCLYLIFSEFLNITDEVRTHRQSKKSNMLGLIAILSLSSFMGINTSSAFFSNAGMSSENQFTTSDTFANIFESNSFTCPTGATTLETEKGVVIFDVQPVKTSVQVIVHDLSPNTSYDLWINQDPGGCPLSAPTLASAFTTDGSGSASESFPDVIDTVMGATKFWISLVHETEVFRSTAVTN